ncbi:MAG TPA: hypothetical protein VFA04_16960 [Bryobacteraceae bacterium]|nr:hypothetical protein [Bryobacteraceae bacterium]
MTLKTYRLNQRITRVERHFKSRIDEDPISQLALRQLTPEEFNVILAYAASWKQGVAHLTREVLRALERLRALENMYAIERTGAPYEDKTSAPRIDKILVPVVSAPEQGERDAIVARVRAFTGPEPVPNSTESVAITRLSDAEQKLHKCAAEGIKAGRLFWTEELDAAAKRYMELRDSVAIERTGRDFAALTTFNGWSSAPSYDPDLPLIIFYYEEPTVDTSDTTAGSEKAETEQQNAPSSRPEKPTPASAPAAGAAA